MVALEDGDGEFVAAQILPDVFDWIEFGGVGRQRNQRDITRDGKFFGNVIAGAVKHEGGMGARGDLAADLVQMQRHDLGVGGWNDDGCGSAALWTDGTEDVGPLIALIAWRARAGASFGPDTGQRALLTDARLVLEPDFDGLVFGVAGEPCHDRCGEVFLKAC